MATTTVKFNKSGIAKLPNDKPVVYKIETAGGKANYVGVAKRGRVKERLNDHLSEGKITGAAVRIEQADTIDHARAREQRIISRMQPKFNKQGK
jgi:excinuclease UvrABC nuclease subunit